VASLSRTVSLLPACFVLFLGFRQTRCDSGNTQQLKTQCQQPARQSKCRRGADKMMNKNTKGTRVALRLVQEIHVRCTRFNSVDKEIQDKDSVLEQWRTPIGSPAELISTSGRYMRPRSTEPFISPGLINEYHAQPRQGSNIRASDLQRYRDMGCVINARSTKQFYSI
jgi:hypothetical protein